MSTFVSQLSPVTGRIEWIVQDDSYDFKQEIARSAFADMLHDTERNVKYYEAIRKAVGAIHRRGQAARVLDIGTGTGLLSMMAAKCGADVITACEAFQPMADCAKKIIEENGFGAKITLIPKRSTQLKIGSDLREPANILVTEVFDTELIGEGAISTFRHAHEHLLAENCIVVPSSATMFVQLVNSSFMRRWNRLEMIEVPGGLRDIVPPPQILRCPGAAAVHDIQLDQVSRDLLRPITEPLSVFRFDLTGQSPLLVKDYHKKVVKIGGSGGICDAILMWWQLEMDTDGEIVLSCAPRWAHPTPDNMQWRDHWMQGIYYPKEDVNIQPGAMLTLHCSHDEYSLWFDITTDQKPDLSTASEMPLCRCGAHVACSRSRIAMLNDASRWKKYIKILKKLISPTTLVLCVSDGSLLSLVAASLSPEKVFVVENEGLCSKVVESYIHNNDFDDLVTVVNKSPQDVTIEDIGGKEISLLIGEPFFTTLTLPWHNLYFWYSRTDLDELLTRDVAVMPCSLSLRAVAIEFKDLWKIRAPIGTCEGFRLDTFDSLTADASRAVDSYVESQPLWEYPGLPLTDEFELMTFDLTQPLSNLKVIERRGLVEFWCRGTCNGIAVWMDSHLDMDRSTTISSGLLSPPRHGQNLVWDVCSRQGVHLLEKPIVVASVVDSKEELSDKPTKLKFRVTFKPNTGDFEFEFTIPS